MYLLKVKYLLLILLILNLKADIPLLGHLKSLSLEYSYPSLNAFGFIARSYFNLFVNPCILSHTHGTGSEFSFQYLTILSNSAKLNRAHRWSSTVNHFVRRYLGGEYLWVISCELPTMNWSKNPSNPYQAIQHYVIKFVSDFRQVGGFLRELRFLPPIKLTTTT